MTDILFDDSETLAVISPVLKIEGHDVLIDSPERRSAGGSQYRRALVHDTNDGLAINYNGDYPGGVSIYDVRSMSVNGDLKLKLPYGERYVSLAGHVPDEIVSLADAIMTLREQVSELQAKLKL